MTLTEFYSSIEDLAADLRAAGRTEDADAVEAAVRGGFTSGEILSDLWVVLSGVTAEPATQARVSAALAFINDTLRPGN